jgi:hypothetical protein
MGILDYFKRKLKGRETQLLHTSPTDDFAEGIVMELKSVVNAAVTQALEEVEGRYLKSILEESYFSLESVVITAQDPSAMSRLEDLLHRHEQVEPGFRSRFFQQVVQRDYRSTRGSSVRPASTLEPCVELGSSLLDPPTDDESYVISLRGRRTRFVARVVLGGPHRRRAPEAPASGQAAHHRVDAVRSISGARLTIRTHDRQGSREHSVIAPVLIGRDAGQAWGESGSSRVELTANYVSRRQLIVFELMGRHFVMVPDDASLTCCLRDGGKLETDRVYRLLDGESLEVVAGVPREESLEGLELDNPAQHPRVVISLEGVGSDLGGTPRPRAMA